MVDWVEIDLYVFLCFIDQKKSSLGGYHLVWFQNGFNMSRTIYRHGRIVSSATSSIPRRTGHGANGVRTSRRTLGIEHATSNPTTYSTVISNVGIGVENDWNEKNLKLMELSWTSTLLDTHVGSGWFFNNLLAPGRPRVDGGWPSWGLKRGSMTCLKFEQGHAYGFMMIYVNQGNTNKFDRGPSWKNHHKFTCQVEIPAIHLRIG